MSCSLNSSALTVLSLVSGGPRIKSAFLSPRWVWRKVDHTGCALDRVFKWYFVIKWSPASYYHNLIQTQLDLNILWTKNSDKAKLKKNINSWTSQPSILTSIVSQPMQWTGAIQYNKLDILFIILCAMRCCSLGPRSSSSQAMTRLCLLFLIRLII